ncbi:MAG: type III secretion system chaperone [Pseudomonadota bacterium]
MSDSDTAESQDSQALMAKVVAGLAEEVGLEDLAADESGYCCLEGEDGRVVHLQREGDELLLMTELGRLPSGEGRLGVVEALLAANAFWQGTRGATVSCELTTDIALIARRLPLIAVDKDGLFAVLEAFLAAAEECRQHLEPSDKEHLRLPPDEFV